MCGHACWRRAPLVANHRLLDVLYARCVMGGCYHRPQHRVAFQRCIQTSAVVAESFGELVVLLPALPAAPVSLMHRTHRISWTPSLYRAWSLLPGVYTGGKKVPYTPELTVNVPDVEASVPCFQGTVWWPLLSPRTHTHPSAPHVDPFYLVLLVLVDSLGACVCLRVCVAQSWTTTASGLRVQRCLSVTAKPHWSTTSTWCDSRPWTTSSMTLSVRCVCESTAGLPLLPYEGVGLTVVGRCAGVVLVVPRAVSLST